ncbi:MAG: hypothetical protein ABFD54_02195 [Armatimonadota bacterium]|nr:hypothetical protein [bacterium]
MKKIRVVCLALLAALILSASALASAQWMKTFNDLYKPKQDTELKKAGCSVCHSKGVELNSYGEMLKGKAIKISSLRAIEKKDADKDGASNIAEIKAGTVPGDSKSKPASKR